MTQINWDIKEENINQLYLKELEVLIQELNVPLKELRIELLPYESLLTLSPGATPIKAFKYVLKGKIIGFLTNEGNHLYPEDLEKLLITEWLKQVNETGDISGIEKIQDKLVFDNPSITLYPLVPPGEYQYFKAGSIINADCNGSLQIIKKVFPNAFADGIESIGVVPLKVNPVI